MFRTLELWRMRFTIDICRHTLHCAAGWDFQARLPVNVNDGRKLLPCGYLAVWLPIGRISLGFEDREEMPF